MDVIGMHPSGRFYQSCMHLCLCASDMSGHLAALNRPPPMTGGGTMHGKVYMYHSYSHPLCGGCLWIVLRDHLGGCWISLGATCDLLVVWWPGRLLLLGRQHCMCLGDTVRVAVLSAL